MASQPESARRLVLRSVVQFTAIGAIALVILALATSVASRRAGEREAINEARITTLIKAQGVVAPTVQDGLVDGDPAAITAVDAVVREQVLDDSLRRVKIWAEDGTILYSDEARLVGQRFDLGIDELEALDTGRIDAEVSDLAKPENRFERDQGKLLEVYLPIRTPAGTPVLFEAYYRYGLVEDNGAELWRSFAPIALGALVVLELVQIPLAWSLARRLRDRLREREHLLHEALDASDRERRRIASDLHDGVVQELAGVAYTLAAADRGGDTPPGLAAEAAEVLRSSVKALRSMIVDIYPPDLEQVGLASALTDLLAGAEAQGIQTRLEVEADVEGSPITQRRLLYRVAQEGVRNTQRHAHATNLAIRTTMTETALTITVEDDGRGFGPGEHPQASGTDGEAHLGLSALEGLVRDAGGRLDIRSDPGQGTTLTATVPNR